MAVPVLDARLEAALSLIHARRHADIGSDHAALPIELIHRERVGHAVIVELNPGPLAHAQRNVARAGLQGRIDIRAGNGLAPLTPGEVDSVSLTGMGALTMRGILTRAGEQCPPALTLQPNDAPLPLRAWALKQGYHLRAERLAPGHKSYPVLRLEEGSGSDPAYDGLPKDAALRYGPHLLREGSELLVTQIRSDIARLAPLAAPGRPAWKALNDARAALTWLEQSTSDKKPPFRAVMETI